MEVVDLIGHVFYALIFLGDHLLGKRSVWGWICKVIGNFGWLFIGLYLELSSLWFWAAVFMGLQIYHYSEWRKDANKNTIS